MTCRIVRSVTHSPASQWPRFRAATSLCKRFTASNLAVRPRTLLSELMTDFPAAAIQLVSDRSVAKVRISKSRFGVPRMTTFTFLTPCRMNRGRPASSL